ncbi:MAG: polymer-forming cytoskeletal protein [Betaproteobacteria bacterium]|nr:polymer-forming cytoskeletal protein [Betaproteobacteria bacterium]
MLESFRRKPDSSRLPSANAHPESPYAELRQALNPAPPPEAAKAEPPKAEVPKAQEHAKPSHSGDDVVCKLIVGPDIKLKGAEITDCDTLVVEGRVEASMDSRVIQIAETGVFVGRAGVDVAEIRGRFDGELTATKQLLIRSTGRVSGTIRYGKIAIEEGGELSGDVGAIGSTSKGAALLNDAPGINRKPAAGSVATPPPHTVAADVRHAGGEKSAGAAH